ncbi:HAL/PAL/TAL family ammonia-lyase [Paenibacillus tyrfis]|uniref:HAL/PAL/TAL family ammonia-lyase n=1 Tax=Paenibacillus tyrfis TaxID=1501230 RepID=UPI000B58F2E5|nr:aromatic amino acid ammonia-lyase [Paenibacillus tyrfis]
MIANVESTGTIEKINLTGNDLTIQEIVRIARSYDRLFEYHIDDIALEKIKLCKQLKQEIIDQQHPIYGVTTGFGDSVFRQISSEKALELQKNLIKFLSCGVGPTAHREVARATMLIRANCLIKGNSAVGIEIIHQILEFLKRDITPLIPEKGSVGASGDLVPLSYLASILTGEGRVNHKGIECDVKKVLDSEGLKPIMLEAKDGLALVNGTSFMSAFACLAHSDAVELASIADICTALTSESLMGNRGHFYSFIHEQKPHPGQKKSAELIYSLLEGSQLSKEYSQIIKDNEKIETKTFVKLTQSIQDRYSVRCAPQVIGVLHDTLEWTRKWLEVEVNSTNDNPIFDIETREVYNGGNFYGGHVVQAMDALKIAVSNIADLLDRQLQLIVDEKFNNNLTANLIQRFNEDDYECGLHHGFKGMQIACSALTAEALKLSNPASVFSRSTEAHNQDKVSMGTISARDARTIVDLTQNVAAIHLITLCQALDLRGIDKMSPKTLVIYRLIREKVPFLERDRPLEKDIKSVVQLIRLGEFRKVLHTIYKEIY